MSAARGPSARAMRQLSVHSHQVRHLHMTGPAPYPTRLAATDLKVTSCVVTDLKPLRCKLSTRAIPLAEHHDDFASGFHHTTTRTMVTSHAPVRPQPTEPTTPRKSTREINTTRALKAQNDTSTMDFAYMPIEAAVAPADVAFIRMPLTLGSSASYEATAQTVGEPAEVMKPQVITAAGEETFYAAPSSMSELSDNNSVGIDYTTIAERMERTAEAVSTKAKETQGTMRQLWDGVVDDIFGPRKPALA